MKLVKYLFLTLICGLSFSSCYKPGQYKVSFHYDSSAYLSGEVYYLDEIENVDIHWISGSINFAYRDDDVYQIDIKEELKGVESLKDVLDIRLVRSAIIDKTLKIYFCASGETYFPQNFYKNLTVTLPKDLSLNHIFTHSIDSEDNFSSLVCSSYDLYSVSGNINVNNINADEINIESVSASINANDVSLNNKLNVNSVSGEIDINKVKATELNIESVSSSLKMKEITGYIDIDTTSGNTTYSLKENEGFFVNFSSVSGSFSSNTQYQRNDNEYSLTGEIITYINCDTVSGSIAINKEQTI